MRVGKAALIPALLIALRSLSTAAAPGTGAGGFVAAVHVAHNLGLSFDQLKAQMVDSGKTLGQAIHVLKPSPKAETEAAKGRREAAKDLKF